MIDLRSDTVTKPTQAMRKAIAEAEVGDDVLGDDPTVLELEEKMASLLGREKSLFVPSGTMANSLAVRCHTQPGDEILLDIKSHIYNYESGSIAAFSGVLPRLLNGTRGIFSGKDVKSSLRSKNSHFAPTSMVCVENTHNRGGGSVWPLKNILSVEQVARENDLKLHLDGARLWNASIATEIPLHGYAQHFDSVSVCFSKGLGAPVGSVLVGSEEFIHQAHRFRKLLGGGMRQAGILAAGALYAVENHFERLKDDHENALILAEGISTLPGIELDLSSVQTNILIFDVSFMSAEEFVYALEQKNILLLAIDEGRQIRAVTNLMVTKELILETIEEIKNLAFKQG